MLGKLIWTVQTAVANAYYSPAERLARWLLMCEDRVQTTTFTMTHEFLKVMLAVQEDGVAAVLSELQNNKAIAFTEGKITILDRSLLEKIARGSYGIPEREYALVMFQKVNHGHLTNGHETTPTEPAVRSIFDDD
ncbi:MAG TPA: helix-turn-helix domain-containing protein [Aestuariivirga sp.]|nr:helix-turn-helix domain-containing protein [Aestuariivirga sp.]